MRVRSLLALLVSCSIGVSYFAGCGDDNESHPPATATDSGTDATTDSTTNPNDAQSTDSPFTDSPAVDANTCTLSGSACGTSAECCSQNCNPNTHICEGGGACKPQGSSCTSGLECCTVSCVGGQCSGTKCVDDTKACTSNEECCSGECSSATDGGAKTCKALNNNCKTEGNSCTVNGDCCSKICSNGVCEGKVSFCTQTGDPCTSDLECCGGKCNRAAGSTYGLCEVVSAPGVPGCLSTGQVCGDAPSLDDGGAPSDAGLPKCGGACCSRACAPYGPTGVLICQPPSGCRPTGETCRDSTDCCGFGGTKNVTGTGECSIVGDAGVGRCDNGNGCRPAGAICKLATTSCNAENNCCSGNVNQDPLVCQQDTLGIPRCTFVGNCADAGSKAGHVCSTSADCCGLPCVPNFADGGIPPFVCGSSCAPLGGACTTSADCCSGIPCTLLPGSTDGICGGILPPGDAGKDATVQPPPDGGGIVPDSGTPVCSLPGQTCNVDGDCCNSSVYKCRNGTCKIPIQ
jgi:hypothetical protein